MAKQQIAAAFGTLWDVAPQACSFNNFADSISDFFAEVRKEELNSELEVGHLKSVECVSQIKSAASTFWLRILNLDQIVERTLKDAVKEREREMERKSPEENWNLKCLTSFTSALQQPRPNTPNTPNTPNSPLHLSGAEKAMAVQHLIMPPIRVQSWHGQHGPRGPKQGPKHGPSQRLQGLAERIGPLPAVFCGHHLQCHLLTLQYLAIPCYSYQGFDPRFRTQHWGVHGGATPNIGTVDSRLHNYVR